MDLEAELCPNVVGSITNLPFVDSAFDVAVAFEVLEHLPFEELGRCLSELRRVSKRRVIVSVPHFGPRLALWL